MYIIQVTFKDKKCYINERLNGQIVLVDDLEDAFVYRSILEFKISWKYGTEFHPSDSFQKQFLKSDAIKFKAIGGFGMDDCIFNPYEKEKIYDKELCIEQLAFKKLIHCPIGSSHWCYDIDDNWIAFPKDNDFDRITKIKYHRSGLVNCLTSYKNWFDRYNQYVWHNSFKRHWPLMMHPLVMKIAFNGGDSTNTYWLTKKEIK